MLIRFLEIGWPLIKRWYPMKSISDSSNKFIMHASAWLNFSSILIRCVSSSMGWRQRWLAGCEQSNPKTKEGLRIFIAQNHAQASASAWYGLAGKALIRRPKKLPAVMLQCLFVKVCRMSKWRQMHRSTAMPPCPHMREMLHSRLKSWNEQHSRHRRWYGRLANTAWTSWPRSWDGPQTKILQHSLLSGAHCLTCEYI